jgi:hypothetical protein
MTPMRHPSQFLGIALCLLSCSAPSGTDPSGSGFDIPDTAGAPDDAAVPDVHDLPPVPDAPVLPDVPDVSDVPDAGSPDASLPPGPLFEIHLVEGHDPFIPSKYGVYVNVYNPWAGEVGTMEVLRIGDCAVFEPVFAPFCDPPCVAPEFCTVDGCRGHKPPLDAGRIVVTGLKVALTLQADPQYHFYKALLDPPITSGNLFDPGDLIAAVAEGAVLPAFELATTGVAGLVTTHPCPFEPGAGTPIGLKWEPSSAATRVRFVMQNEYHGGQFSRIVCDTADDGELVIDAAIVSRYLEEPKMTEAWRMDRYAQGVVSWAGGGAVLRAVSRADCRYGF